MTNTAVLYARDGNGDPDSIRRQLEAGRDYAVAQGLDVVGEYFDGIEVHFRQRPARPGLASLLEAVEAGGVDAVVVAGLDRMARRVADWEVIARSFATSTCTRSTSGSSARSC